MQNNSDNLLYTTLKHDGHAEFTEKKSIFIGHAARAQTEAQAMDFVRNIKEKYHDAKHNVFAYSISNGTLARYSDDGEPQGSAGMPILGVIKKSGVDDCVVAVTRYFGGILLGTGGLVRAYSAAAAMAVEQAEIITYSQYNIYKIVCSYAEYNKISFELELVNAIIDSSDFGENVTLVFAVKSDISEPLCKKISEMSGGKLIPESIGTRFDA